jgi:nucleoid-associated protein YgaU
MMTRDTKLALILGFALLLIVGLVISDHFAVDPEGEVASPGTTLAAGTPITRTPLGGQTRLLDEPRAETHASPAPEPVSVPEAVMGGSGASTAVALLDQEGDDGRGSLRPEWVNRAIEEFNKGRPPAAIATDEHRKVDRDSEEREPRLVEPRRGVRTHVVGEGESLWSIAEAYYGDGFMHEQLAAANTDVLGPRGELPRGATLRIPPASELGGTRRAAPAPTPERKAPATKTYTVREGDVLSKISQKLLGTSKRWREILELNGDKLERAEDLRVGMVLVVPAE